MISFTSSFTYVLHNQFDFIINARFWCTDLSTTIGNHHFTLLKLYSIAFCRYEDPRYVAFNLSPYSLHIYIYCFNS